MNEKGTGNQTPIRPKPTSQAGRILQLLESAKGAKVHLPEILALHIAQYGARIHELRHKYGFRIENGSVPGRPDHTWFQFTQDDPPAAKPAAQVAQSKPQDSPCLFSESELQRTARWEDQG